MEWPTKVKINDVLLRDGLQLEEKILTVEDKKQLAEGMISAGIKSLEFGSFVHPIFVPQMANSGELFNELKGEEVSLVSLVPNKRGVERAAELKVPRVNVVLSISDTHNLQNVKQTTEESIEKLKEIKQVTDANNIKLEVSLATFFGCPFEGEMEDERIFSVLEKIIPLDLHMISLADTTGVANPKQVYRLVSKVLKRYTNENFNMHFHDTRRMGLPNILAAIQAGGKSFDTSLGGLGGCPFAPGATGNVSTEDVVHMLHSMDIETDIDLDVLLETSKVLSEMVGHALESSVVKAGKYDRKYPIPE